MCAPAALSPPVPNPPPPPPATTTPPRTGRANTRESRRVPNAQIRHTLPHQTPNLAIPENIANVRAIRNQSHERKQELQTPKWGHTKEGKKEKKESRALPTAERGQFLSPVVSVPCFSPIHPHPTPTQRAAYEITVPIEKYRITPARHIQSVQMEIKGSRRDREGP